MSETSLEKARRIIAELPPMQSSATLDTRSAEYAAHQERQREEAALDARLKSYQE